VTGRCPSRRATPSSSCPPTPAGDGDASRRLFRAGAGRGRDQRHQSEPATAKYRELGTLANLLAFNAISALPSRNFQSATFDGTAELAGPAAGDAAGDIEGMRRVTRSIMAAARAFGLEMGHRLRLG